MEATSKPLRVFFSPCLYRGRRLLGAVAFLMLLPGLPARADNPRQADKGEVNEVLTVKYAINRICGHKENGQCTAWDEVKLRSYNGRLVGPTIEARPGDTLNILLDNQLPPEPMPESTSGSHDGPSGSHDTNTPHGFNTTNIHTHGLHVSPAGNSDNVMLAIGPGQKFQYEIKIPSDHPAGTYWYHAHKHGSVALQLASGMAGAVIIRGDIDKVPAIRAAKEQIFVFQQIPYLMTGDPYHPGQQANMVESYELFGPGRWLTSGRRTTINGEFEPVLKMKPGEVQRWRFIHAGIRETIRPKLVRESDLEAVILQHQIALDGITTGRIEPVAVADLQPGYRVDVMVQAGDVPETYLLLDAASPANQSLMGLAEPQSVLARVVVEGKKKQMELPEAAELLPLAPFAPIADEEITGSQSVTFDINLQHTPFLFTVNGQPFDPHATPRQLKLGAVEEWIVSASPLIGHPFHIHVNPFQVMTENGPHVWKDTLFVERGTSVRIRTRYERYIGKFVLHCHILDHEDQGMMEAVEIVPPSTAHDSPHSAPGRSVPVGWQGPL